ncbi:MAG TPA: hypothetical protein DCY07_03285 [Rhodospirillaceae bacterium]|nr:hypothetical protein [Rhodospirillaceae bacterium]
MLYRQGFEIGDVFTRKANMGSFLTEAGGQWVIVVKTMMEQFKLDRYPVFAIRKAAFPHHDYLRQTHIPEIGEHCLRYTERRDKKGEALAQAFYFFTLDEVKIVERADIGIPHDQQAALKNEWIVGKNLVEPASQGTDIMIVSQILTRRKGFPEIFLGLKDAEKNHALLPLAEAMKPDLKIQLYSGSSLKELGLAAA